MTHTDYVWLKKVILIQKSFAIDQNDKTNEGERFKTIEDYIKSPLNELIARFAAEDGLNFRQIVNKRFFKKH